MSRVRERKCAWRPRQWFGALGARLLAAFLVVGVGTVGIFTAVAWVGVDRQSTALAQAQRSALREQIAAALAAAYQAGRGSWGTGDLSVLEALAQGEGAQVTVLDGRGEVVAQVGTEVDHPSHDGHGIPPAGPGSPTPPSAPSPQPREGTSTSTTRPHVTEPGGSPQLNQPQEPGGAGSPTGEPGRHEQEPQEGQHAERQPAALPTTVKGLLAVPVALAQPPPTPATPSTSTVTIPVVVDGQRVGTARIVLPTAAPRAVAAARADLLRTVWIGAGLAVLLAVAAAVVVARLVSRPLVALAAATRAFAAGDPHPDRLLRPAPGELGEVGEAFRAMAATVAHQDELRRTVVADVAHELRTPVAILRGETEALLDGIADPTPDRIVSLHDEVLRLGRLTDDLATLSAADAAGLTLTPSPVDLGGLVGRATSAMRAQFDDAGLTVRLDVEPGVAVPGDGQRLTQVVTNLLTNAAKFTPAGGAVAVGVHRSGPEAVLTVADTGPGLDPDELPHMFERFWRGRAAGGRAGSGIGLAVVKALVDAHGGRVRAERPPEGGARFTVTLPAQPVSPANSVGPADSANPAGSGNPAGSASPAGSVVPTRPRGGAG